MDGLFSVLGNAVHGIANSFAPKKQPQPVQPVTRPPQQSFIQQATHFAAPAIQSVEKTAAPVVAPLDAAVKLVQNAVGLATKTLGPTANKVASTVNNYEAHNPYLNTPAMVKNAQGKTVLNPKYVSQNVDLAASTGDGGEVGKVVKGGLDDAVKAVQGAKIEDVAKAFNTTPEALTKGAKPPVEQPLDRSSMSKPGAAALRPGPKMSAKEQAATQAAIDRQQTSSNNPMVGKINIPKVEAGDYQKARGNTQLASNPVEVAGGQALHSISKLSKAEKASFWQTVENPTKSMSANMKEAVTRWRALADRVHATSQSLGGDTPYVQNYARHNWDLSNPEDKARFDQLAGGMPRNPSSFKGLDSQPRVFNSIAEGKAAGFKLANPGNPAKDIQSYIQGSAHGLRMQALVKGVTEADRGQATNRSFDLKNGTVLPVSEQGLKAIKSFDNESTAGKALKGYRATNKGLKKTLLSASQFHPININALQAAPTLVAKGHPVSAAKGLVGGVTAISRNVSDKIIQKALEDGTIENGARLGTPIKFGSDYSTSGKLTPGGASGEKMIFERQLPAMHVQMVRSLVNDLQKRGVSLDSPEAREAGLTVNKIMGYVNTELENHNPQVQRALGDILLAPQFTRSKFEVLKDALTHGGQSGSYARAAVIGKYATEAGLAIGAGAALGQKSDSPTDTLIRTAVNPAIPTPFKDAKGNNIELGLPHNYISEGANLLASLGRDSNGRMNVGFNPNNILPNVETYAQGRLAQVPSAALKVLTNQNYAGKPLYDPTAPAGTKAEQAATTLVSDQLPIGLQGVAQSKAVASHLPANVSQVLEDSKSTTNPLVGSIASAVGLSPKTDKTVGQGLNTTEYFNALDGASGSLEGKAKDAFDLAYGSDKNPVTGQYLNTPNSNMTPASYQALLAYPQALAAATKLNQTLQAQGQKIDPFFNLTADQQKAYGAYETMAPDDPNRSNWETTNKSWYQGFITKQDAYYNSLPPSAANKPQNPIKYPTPTAGVANLENFYSKNSPAWTSTQKSNFLNSYPDLTKQFAAETAYDNQVRVARGYAPVKILPNASPELENFTNNYFASTDKKSMESDPLYSQMEAALTQEELSSVDTTAAQARLVGSPDTTTQELKDMRDIVDYGLIQSGPSTNPTLSTLGSANPSPGPGGTPTPTGGTLLGYGGSSSSSSAATHLPAALDTKSPIFTLLKGLKSASTKKFTTKAIKVPKGSTSKTKISKPGKVTLKKSTTAKLPKSPTIKVTSKGEVS